MPARVSRVGHVVDAAELRVRQIVLRRGKRCGLQGRIVGAEIGREHVDVPALDQVDARRTLIHELQQVVGAELVLHSGVPVRHVAGMQVAVHPVDAARAEVSADIGRGVVGPEVIDHGRGTLAELEERPRIAGSELLHHLRLVFVELLQPVGESDVDRVDAESAAEAPVSLGRATRRPMRGWKFAQAALVQSLRWDERWRPSSRSPGRSRSG